MCYCFVMYKHVFRLIFVFICLFGISNTSVAAASLSTKTIEQVQQEKRVYLLGQFEPSSRKDFVLIPSKYLMGGTKMYLRKETYNAFVKMRNAALKDKITLNIASATRNFNYQKGLWEKKWTGVTLVDGGKLPITTPDELMRFEKILEYSAAPGTSRHHWGTDIDINGADTKYFETKTGKKVYAWLVKNASTYGFCQPYNKKDENRLSGYNEEKWHWSYTPLAKDFLKDYLALITDEYITGFLGDTQVKNLYLIPNYVASINPECI
jgi:D-alanyl-D-alanine carboxypeptidase